MGGWVAWSLGGGKTSSTEYDVETVRAEIPLVDLEPPEMIGKMLSMN